MRGDNSTKEYGALERLAQNLKRICGSKEEVVDETVSHGVEKIVLSSAVSNSNQDVNTLTYVCLKLL